MARLDPLTRDSTAPILMRVPIFLVLLAVVAGGCSVSGRVESEIEGALPAALGPADSYDATVGGVDLGAGTADRISIVGERVAREDAPVVDRLTVELRGVRYDRKTKRIDGAQSARATARVLPLDLADYLARQRGVGDARITLAAPDRATVRVQGEVQGVRLPVAAEVTGRLEAQGGTVRLVVDDVRAAGIGLGGGIARRLEERINPVIDLTDEALALRVTGVRVEGGELVLEAEGDVAGLRLRRQR